VDEKSKFWHEKEQALPMRLDSNRRPYYNIQQLRQLVMLRKRIPTVFTGRLFISSTA